jgi:hypothetical protein
MSGMVCCMKVALITNGYLVSLFDNYLSLKETNLSSKQH